VSFVLTIVDSQIEATLAARLRKERETRGWTLADLALRSNVSRAMISKVERAEASPTAGVLGRLSAAFGLTLSQLFARVDGEVRGWLSRAAEQPAWRDPQTGFLRRSLSPPGNSPMELVWGELPAGAEVTYSAAAYAFIVDQQIVVFDGQLTVVQGDAAHDLECGDCLRLGPPQPVSFHNRSSAQCRYLVAVLRAAEDSIWRNAPPLVC
jgi:transcriptional regulator with XRE-family HTH domain